MICQVFYTDLDTSNDEIYEVEANDVYQAEEYFKGFIRDLSKADIHLICEKDIEDDFQPDAHSCSAEADDYGICTVCGAIVRGTIADYELHGYDPC